MTVRERQVLIETKDSRYHLIKINGRCAAGNPSRSLILAGFFATSCLSLKGHDHKPDMDEKPRADCSGVSCWEPPSNTCDENGAVEVHAPSGYCSRGQCFYSAGQVPCREGLCDGGICVETPCQGVTCVDPPEPRCEDADRTIWAPTGYCVDGKCQYASKTSTCDAPCTSGACVDSPCAEVFCRKPPAPYCEDDSSLVVFSPGGHCTVAEKGPECLYDSQTIRCANGCRDGRCKDEPCAGVFCDYPPASYCDGAVLVVFEPHGTCDEKGMCSYTEGRRPCIEPCVDAHCGEDDACAEVTCDKPPASHCVDESTLRVYARDGSCNDGFCSYAPTDEYCSGGCEEGRCKKAPCRGVTCDTPPAAYCKGTTLVSFDFPGICTGGWCDYPDTSVTCSDGCRDGACVTGGANAVTWIFLPGGTFEMGSLIEPDEQPVHSVDVPSFEMTRSEVTVAQYKACVTEGACSEPGTWDEDCYWNKDGFGAFPVNCVAWQQAVTFCQWIGGRLPSETQWEYAARSAGKNITYPWGEEAPSCDYAVFKEGSDNGCGTALPWAVCSKPAGNTDQDLCDMAGNIIEWVQDTWHSNYEGGPADGSAWEGGSNRVTRGSGYLSLPSQMRSADRGGYFGPTYTNVFLGVRCIREVQ